MRWVSYSDAVCLILVALYNTIRMPTLLDPTAVLVAQNLRRCTRTCVQSLTDRLMSIAYTAANGELDLTRKHTQATLGS